MGNEEENNALADALRIGGGIWDAADRTGLLDKVRDFFTNPSPIIVFGSTGSGKTNFLTSLAAGAKLIDPISRDDRTEQVERSRIKIVDRPFSLIDTPGQRAHQHLRSEVVREAIGRAPVRIINVVSYGYHEYRMPSVADAVDGEGNPRPEYLQRHRVDELAALDEWLPLLGDRGTTKWILTVVTKADLWWNDQNAAVAHYDAGAYSELIKKADPKLHHVVRPYCSVIHRFFGSSRLPGTFDDSERMKLVLEMLQQLSSLPGTD